MISNQNSDPAPGWAGGFAASSPAFAYPNPNLTSLPMLGNMANINLLQRQQGVEWPEFSWKTQREKADPKRCFQMFAPYISRLGYTDTGRVYSIICPQQGIYIQDVGYMNVEVTVTGQRGWVDENTKEIAADMTVDGKVWFGPSMHRSSLGAELLTLIEDAGYPVPADKAHAIIVKTHAPKKPNQPIFPVRRHETKRFKSPDFARHHLQAWAVGNVEVEIGPIQQTRNSEVDAFNELVMELFNLISGNMLQSGNLLSWNVWFTAPQLVNQKEWEDHAEKWRKSIDEDHGSPDGPGTEAKYFNGNPFKPVDGSVEKVFKKIYHYLKHL